jgi:hypothetical protein
MKPLSDASQIAAIDAAISAITGKTSPTPRERELLADHLTIIKERIERAEQRAREKGGEQK